MKRFIEGEDLGQGTLLPELLDDYVAEYNLVRVVDVFVEELGLAGSASSVYSPRKRIGPRTVRKPAANDIDRLPHLWPALEMGGNDQASGKFAPLFAAQGYRTVVLPTSSTAHMALTFEQKLELWCALVGTDAVQAPLD